MPWDKAVKMTAAAVMSLVALVAAVIALLMALWQRKALSALRQQLKTLATTLKHIDDLQKDQPLASVTNRFSAHLNDAEKNQQESHQELKAKLQENNAVKPQGQADKYRYAVALAAQGQSVDSIAEVLNMAPAEVEQVMQLARVKR